LRGALATKQSPDFAQQRVGIATAAEPLASEAWLALAMTKHDVNTNNILTSKTNLLEFHADE